MQDPTIPLMLVMATTNKGYLFDLTEAGIDSGFTRDLFVALGEHLNNGDWSLRIYVKPFINWIWLGALIMAFGGVLSISDRRYRTAKIAEKPKAYKTPSPVLLEQQS